MMAQVQVRPRGPGSHKLPPSGRFPLSKSKSPVTGTPAHTQPHAGATELPGTASEPDLTRPQGVQQDCPAAQQGLCYPWEDAITC